MTLLEASKQFNTAAQRLPTLFDLEDHAYELLALLEQVEEAEDKTALESQLALVDQMLIEKCESYVSVIRTLEAMGAARKAEADRLRDRAASANAHAEWLKNRLLVHMKTTGQERIETARFSISIRTNPPAVQVLEPAMVPSEYQRTKITVDVDKRLVLDAYKKDGVLVPGTEITRGERLEVR